MTVAGVAFARAGLLGNPSDGYGGKAIACPVLNFAARVSVERSDRFSISAGGAEAEFPDLGTALDGALPAHVDDLERLVLAATRRLASALDPARLPTAPLAITCSTTVPRQVGLAGSSAVIIATLRALGTQWGATLPPFELSEMALATEVTDLGIAAGPMDRVIQSYERVMAMDLAPPRSESAYRTLDAGLIPPLLIAWDPRGGQSSGEAHGDLRGRWRRGDEDIVETIEELRGVVDRGLTALKAGDGAEFAQLVDYNFKLRCRVFSVSEPDREMVSLARRLGAAAKLCGSGGAVLVVPRKEADLVDLERELEVAGFQTCRSEIA